MSKRINFKLKQKLDEDSFKSNKELNKYGDFQEKRENSIHYSPAKTEFNFNDNDDNDDLYSNISDIKKEEKEEKEFNIKLVDNNKEIEKENKKNYIIDKPLDMGKVGSTLKNYFNSNKGYKGKIQNSHKLLPVNPEINAKNAIEQNNSDKNNNLEKKKNKSVINKESDNEFSGEEEKIKSIINLKNKNKSAKIKDTKKENNTTQSDLEEVKFSSKNLNSIKNSPNKSKKNKLNKSIKIAKTNDKYKVSSFVNSPKISVNTAVENNNDKNNKNLLTLNHTQDNKDQNNNNNEPSRTLTKNNSPLKIDTINSDKSDFSNNFKESEEKKIIKAKAKFSFITTTNNIKESSKNDMNKTIESNNPINYKNIQIADERMNLDFALLNKKIVNTNNRITELYLDSEKKIDKISQYVKTVFDHLSGVFFFKNLYNQKFSFDFSPKTLMTQTDFSSGFPALKNNKTKIILKGNNKYFTPINRKKQETYKTIVNRIEPYLIKKFKE